MWYNPPDEAKRESFHQGTCFDAYRFLGAHPVDENGEMKWHFTVWAPNAKKVSVTGEFCDWALEAYPMEKQYDGTWELRLPAILFTPERDPQRYQYPEAADRLRSYKYAVLCADDTWHLELRAEAEYGATQGRADLAKKAKELNLDAIHDIVHEIGRDEARHGKGFQGLLDRYFK